MTSRNHKTNVRNLIFTKHVDESKNSLNILTKSLLNKGLLSLKNKFVIKSLLSGHLFAISISNESEVEDNKAT